MVDINLRKDEILQGYQLSLSAGIKMKTLSLVIGSEFKTVQLNDNPARSNRIGVSVPTR